MKISNASAGQNYPDIEIRLKPDFYKLDIRIAYDQETLSGRCRLTLTNDGKVSVQKVPLLLYRLLWVNTISDKNGNDLDFTQQVLSFEDFRKLQVNYIEVILPEALQNGMSATLMIDYEGYLLGYTETGMLYIKDHIDPQFTIIRPDCRAYPEIGVPSWEVNYKEGLPEFDYEISITVPDTLVAANSGILGGKTHGTGTITYNYKSARPSWRIDIPIAMYGIFQDGSKKIFYFKEDSLRAGKILQAIDRTMDLYTGWFGPVHDQSGFTLIEIPDGWGSQTTASCIIQSAGAFKDDQRMYELYHEISHLWNAPKTDAQPPRWEEGLAMFLQYLTVEKLEQRTVLHEQVDKTLQRLRKTLTENPEYQNIAMIDYGKRNATRLSYSAGMLFFYNLYEILGEDDFLNINGSFYQKYHEHGATTEEFITFVKNHAGVNVDKLFRQWFYESKYSSYITDGLPMNEILKNYR